MDIRTHVGEVTRWGVYPSGCRGRITVTAVKGKDSSFPVGSEVYVDEALLRGASLLKDGRDPIGLRVEFLPRENRRRPGRFYADLLCPERLGEAVAA